MFAYSSEDERRPRRHSHVPRDSPNSEWGKSRQDEHNGFRKRRRSLSRDEERPRKRRSMTPEDAGRGHRDCRRRNRSRDYSQEHENSDRRDISERSHREDNPESSRHRRRRPDRDKDDRRHTQRRRDRSGSRSSPRRRRSASPKPFKRSTQPLPSQQNAFDTERAVIRPDAVPEKQKPNYATSGRLAAASNTVKISSKQSIVLKYHEPSESRKPPASDAWRMYIFKDSDIVDTLELFTQSCWLLGREEAVCDLFVEHPSVSGQHCVLQFRYVEKVVNEWGEKKGRVKLYVIDLESKKGTWLNGKRVEEARYMEIRDGDVLKLGESAREYVLQLPPKAKEKG